MSEEAAAEEVGDRATEPHDGPSTAVEQSLAEGLGADASLSDASLSDASLSDASLSDGVLYSRMPRARRLFNFVRRIAEAYDRDDVPLLSAAIAFYALLSIAPILILALAVADAAAAGEAVRTNITRWLNEHVGNGVAEMIDEWVRNFRSSDDSRYAVYVSLIVLLVSATRLFAHIRTALDRIWRIQSAPPTTLLANLRARVLGLAIVGLLGGLLLSSLFVKVMLRMLARHFGFEHIPFMWVLFDWSLYFLLVGGLVYVMYRRLPHAVVPRKHARRGAALTAVLLIMGGEVIAFYLARPGVTSSFGAAGSVMALVLWVYYATQVFLVGAIFTWVFAQKGARARRRTQLLRRKWGSARKDKGPKPGAAAEAPPRLDIDEGAQKARVAAPPDQPAPAKELDVERATLADASDPPNDHSARD